MVSYGACREPVFGLICHHFWLILNLNMLNVNHLPSLFWSSLLNVLNQIAQPKTRLTSRSSGSTKPSSRAQRKFRLNVTPSSAQHAQPNRSARSTKHSFCAGSSAQPNSFLSQLKNSIKHAQRSQPNRSLNDSAQPTHSAKSLSQCACSEKVYCVTYGRPSLFRCEFLCIVYAVLHPKFVTNAQPKIST